MLLIDTRCGKQFAIVPNRYTEKSVAELNSNGFFCLTVKFNLRRMSLLVNRGNGREVYQVALVTHV